VVRSLPHLVYLDACNGTVYDYLNVLWLLVCYTRHSFRVRQKWPSPAAQLTNRGKNF
jgi:hypothetical protein